MTFQFDAAFDRRTPTHRLGQYTAWRLRHGVLDPIDMIWISIARARNPAAHRVLPHGEPSIAIRRRRDRAGAIRAIDLAICGPFGKAMWYRPEPREELIAVRLKPELAADIFNIAPGDWVDAPPMAAPATLQTACAASLQTARASDAFDAARALVVDLRRFAAEKTPGAAPEIFAAALLRRAAGRIHCAALADHLEVSERHLRRRFRHRLGCSPKHYARQLRLAATALAAETEDRPRWAQIAARAGFHDQAHMINEFKAMLDLTPQHFHRERRALTL